jgi:hypothetical protein
VSDLPIEPGSPVDLAMDTYLWHLTEDQPAWTEPARQIELENPAHMLALGTRLFATQRGIFGPKALVAPLYRQWYGQFPEQS